MQRTRVENFHSRATKESVYIRKVFRGFANFLKKKETFDMRNEFTTDKTFSVHQHGRCVIVLFCSRIGKKKSVTSVTMIAKFLDDNNMEMKQQ